MYWMYWLYTDNISVSIIVYSVLLISSLIWKYIDDLLDFKKFAKEFYYLDINIFKFSLILFKDKIKIM